MIVSYINVLFVSIYCCKTNSNCQRMLFLIVVLPGHSHLLSMNDNSVSTVRAEYYVILKLLDFSVYKKA